MTVLRIPGVANIRDVGGIPVGGSQVREGVLLRSGNLARLTAEGGDLLRSRVRRVVDLRDDAEVAAEPSALSEVVVTRVPLFLGSVASFFAEDLSLTDMYRHLVDDAAPRLIDAIRIIAEGDPTLVHCTVGKDRTGVTVALALSAVGADREAVIADYALTASQLPERRSRSVLRYLQAQHPEARHLVDLVTASPAPVMRGLLAELDARHGSVADYLQANGLGDDELRALRVALVA
ncbi:MAG: tyrosine-protein phosphatase [Microbacterium sp.]